MWVQFKEFIDTFMPLLVVIVVPMFSYFGAHSGRKKIMEECAVVLNEQGDEAIMQYKVIKTLLNVMLSLINVLHEEKVLNGNAEPIRKEILEIQDMLDKDVIERKRKNFYVRKHWKQEQ
jgi:hypothetical protein